MMQKRLTPLHWRRVVSALERLGYEVDHHTGSHIVMRRKEPPHYRVVVPCHREVSVGTLRAIIRHARVGRQEFLDALED